ncbi:MAG: rhodanese-like domain-containing protein [Sulfurimonas sp.]|jgi:thiosulfate/3-mercaptopyruvate sulfurtransferase
MKHLLISLLLTFNAIAYDAFIAPHELRNTLKDPELILLDVSNRSDYEHSHLAGALHLDISKFIKSKHARMAVSFSQRVQKELSRLGINENSKVVIYTRNQKDDCLNSTYLAFMLAQHGFENVTILDGGYMAWVFKYHDSISTKESKPSKDGTFEIKHNSSLSVIGEPKQKLISLKLKELFFDDFTLRSDGELRENLIGKFNLNNEDEIFVSAETIFEASPTWYILYKKFGFKNTKIYDVSLEK